MSIIDGGTPAANTGRQVARYQAVVVESPTDPTFDKAYRMLKRHYDPDMMDPRRAFVSQMNDQKNGEWKEDSYRMVVITALSKGNKFNRVEGACTFNYLHKGNFVFENYGIATRGNREVSRLIVDTMANIGAKDASSAGYKELSGILLEAAPAEVEQKAGLGYRQFRVRYFQPPLEKGKKAVELPLLYKITNLDDPSLVRNADGEVTGVKSDKVLTMVGEMLQTVYEKPNINNVRTPQYMQITRDSINSHEVVAFV